MPGLAKISLTLREALAPLLFSPPQAVFELYGYFDGVHGRYVEGWAFDAASPLSRLMLEVLDDAVVLGTTQARLFRADLQALGILDGSHAFRFELPESIFDGKPHQISIRVANSHLSVPGGPRLLHTQSLVPYCKPTSSQAAGSCQTLASESAILLTLQCLADTLTAQTELLRVLLTERSKALPVVGCAESRTPQSLLSSPDTAAHLASALARRAGKHDYIVFSIIDWSFRTQRPQHLAAQLAARDNRVFYLSTRFLEMGSSGARFSIVAEPVEGVFEVALHCRSPHPVIYNGICDHAQLLDLIKALQSLVSMLRLQRIVGLLHLPSWYPLAKAIPGITVVFDCLDHLAGFNNIAPRVVELEQTLITEADAVITTSDYLYKSIRKSRLRVDLIRNGVDVSYFAQQPQRVHPRGQQAVIGYYGAIADWFDLDVVLYCAQCHPEWLFLLIGSVENCDVQQAAQCANILFMGEKPYTELTYYLYSFDVCLIPFKVLDLTNATNPVKLYEYLCAGKPVVASDLPELRKVPHGLVRLANSPAQFEKAIAGCLRDRRRNVVRQRRSWAARHSWEARTDKLARVIARCQPLVSIVVLCYNNIGFTKACINSVLASTDYPELEIICVDNGSCDGTEEYLSALAQTNRAIRVVRNESNLGFPAGNNLGIRAARGEFIILLNNDTYVTRGWVRDLIRPLQLYPDIGLTGPLTNMAGNEQKVAVNYSNMSEMAQVSSAFTASRRRALYPCRSLAFFCVAIPRAVLETVGELDESYGRGYFEDDDYCRRVQEAGYRLVICDDVFVHHHHSASFGQIGNSARAALMKRNRRIFERRWGPWSPHEYRREPGFGEV